MAPGRTNPVDAYLAEAKKWRAEMTRLRAILLGCGLAEEWKWNKPCYTFQKANVVLILGLKEYCSLLLCKGALLKDAKKILIKAGENTQAARQIRFTDVGEIAKLESTLKAYLREAIAAEKAGLEVTYKTTAEYAVPTEFQARLKADPALKAAFAALTPGRQRAYLLHFSAPKQAATRDSRIGKCRPLILAGKGLTDEYRASRKA